MAVEVKLLVDPHYRAAEAEAHKAGYVVRGELTKSWTVDLEHRASWKDARRALPELLAALEALNWTGGGDFWRLRHVAPRLRNRLIALGLDSAWPVEPTEMHPPGYYLMPAGWGGSVPDIDALSEFCDRHLASESMSKMREQLANADTDERHGFFVVGWEHMIVSALTNTSRRLPSTAPQLVDGIDAIWVTPITTGCRVLAWLPDEGWLQAAAPPLDASARAEAD